MAYDSRNYKRLDRECQGQIFSTGHVIGSYVVAEYFIEYFIYVINACDTSFF